MSFAVVELDFEVLQNIRSLPPFHGARWAAVFRYACRAAEIDVDSVIWGIMPWCHGTKPWDAGQYIGVRLLVDVASYDSLQALLLCLQRGVEGDGEFIIGQTLRLSHAYCGLSGKDMLTAGQKLAALGMEHLFSTARTLTQTTHWALRFDIPVRLSRPQGQRGVSGKYCDQTFFHENQQSLERIIEKIRFMPWTCPPQQPWPTLEKSTLVWQDMRYNKERGMALGGVTGELVFSSSPHPSLALALAFGQFSGVGKNPRFGLGYYSLKLL